MLRNTLRVIRDDGNKPSALGLASCRLLLHSRRSVPASAFLATAQLVSDLVERNGLSEFIAVRRPVEEFLMKYKELCLKLSISLVAEGSVANILEWYKSAYKGFQDGLDDTAILASTSRSKFGYLTPYTEIEDESSEPAGKRFSRKVKAAAFIQEAFKGVSRCSICNAALHVNSIQIDHAMRKRDGGSSRLPVPHRPSQRYCNSGVKN